MIPASTKFYLRVRSDNAGNVIPFRKSVNPELYARAMENYDSDEDFTFAAFELKDIDDLINLLKFYAGTGAQIELAAELETEEFKADSILSGRHHKPLAGYVTEKGVETLSPAAASEMLITISRALFTWHLRNEKQEESA